MVTVKEAWKNLSYVLPNMEPAFITETDNFFIIKTKAKGISSWIPIGLVVYYVSKETGEVFATDNKSKLLDDAKYEKVIDLKSVE